MRTKKLLAAVVGIVMSMSLATTAFAATFTDVPDTHAYKAAIDFCADKGYVLGTGTNTFSPDTTLTRSQLATVWCRALEMDATNHTFSDISKLSRYYDTPVIVLHSLGILHGTSATEFSVNSNITREQLALITMRTYDLGVANDDDYKSYSDYASISTWAQNGVSACLNANVFDGLFDEDNFKPKQAVTRAELCQLIYNINMPAYTVSVGTLTGGTITASPTSARAGALVTLTISPETNMQLKTGTLKYNGIDITGTSFTMPANDVTITAEFEAIPVTLSSIAVTTDPDKMTYNQGEALSLTGMVVTATYSDGSTNDVTGYTTTPAANTTLDTAGTVPVTVTYTEDTIEKTTTFDVTVNAI